MGSRGNQALSVRLYVQAALTVLFAPLYSDHKGFLVTMLVLAGGAAALGAWVSTAPAQARNATIGFEAVAVVAGVFGLIHHTYVPGTIVGVATLIAVLNTASVAAPVPAGTATAAAVPAAVAQPVFPAGSTGQGFPAQPYTAQPYTAQPYAAQAYAAQPVMAQTAVMPAGQWAADPSGRHHYRWWDGRTWTEHVSTNGTPGVDPLH